MREKPKDSGRLQHIMAALENISEFLEDKSAADLTNDKLLYFAVVKNLEIIGEAAYMLTPEFKAMHPEISWKDMVGMRHILVHGYYQVDARIVWETIVNDLPPLKINWCNIWMNYLESPKHSLNKFKHHFNMTFEQIEGVDLK